MLNALPAFGLAVDNIHVRIEHPPVAPFDTVVNIAAGTDSLVLTFPVEINGASEELTVQIELRSGTIVLFSGTQKVLANAGAIPSGSAPTIPIVYVGPGARATSLTIAPRDTTIRVNGSVAYQVTAHDSSGGLVSGTAVAWAVADPSLGSIDASGTFTAAGNEGRTRITARTPNGLRDSVSLFITAPPTRVVVVGGDSQSGVVGSALAQPIIAEVQTASGTPVPDVAVTFSAPAAGVVTPTAAITDTTGRAQAVMTLGHTAGSQQFIVSSTGLTSDTLTADAKAGAPAAMAKVSGDAQADSIGTTLAAPFVVKVSDQFSNPATGAVVDWRRTAGAGSLAGDSSITGSDGTASVGYTLGTALRTDTVTAVLRADTSARVRFTATATPRHPSSIARQSGNAQTAGVASALPNPLVVLVRDAGSHPVPGIKITWTVIAGGGSVNPDSSVTDSAGQASTTLTLGTAAGQDSVTASAGAGLTTQFGETAVAGPAAVMTKSAGDSQTVTAGSALPIKPAVRITDAHGNPIAGDSVVFAVTAGGGSATGLRTATNASGVAAVGGWTLGSSGVQTLTATSDSLSVAFSATASPPAGAFITTQLSTHLDTLTSLGDTAAFTAQARDSLNAAIPGTFAWVSRTPSVATVDTAGHVVAAANGSTWVVATESRGSKDSALVVVKQLVVTVQVTPGTRDIYRTRTYQFSASVVDGRGHPVAGSPAIAWSSTAPAVATVDSTGLVTGLTLGTTQVKATVNSIVGVADITILTPITRIEVGRDSSGTPVTDTTSLKSLGDTRSFVAVAHDTLDAPMTGVTFTWATSNGSVAILDSVGSPTARAKSAANGVATISAAADGVTGGATLKVAQVLDSIDLSPDTLTVGVAGSGALTARGLDARARFISGGTFTFTSLQPTVATVNSTTGVVTGVLNGTARMVATNGTITSDTAVVLVNNSVPPRISFGRDTLTIGRGSTVPVPVYLSKTSGQAVTVNLTVGDTAAHWSTTSVTIPAGQTSVNATLIGHNAGTTFVTATDGSGTGFAGDTAALAVQATMQLASTGFSMNATDQVATQVVLSDPSPAGGTYVTFAFGTPNVVTVSPDPAFIPAGQLAADVQVIGVGAGSSTITPQAAGVNGTAATSTVYAAKFSFSPAYVLLGAGQQESHAATVPTYTNQAVTFSLAGKDSNVARVPASLTITKGGYYAYFTLRAVAAGVDTITAAAPGWTLNAPMSVVVSTPHVGICCGVSIVTTAPTQNFTVYSEDSTKAAHARTSSLVVHLASSDTTVMKVLDTVVTIVPGATSNSSARAVPGGMGGTAYIIASAGGHTPDSVLVTVTGPKLSLNWTQRTIGVGQQDPSMYVSTPNPVSAPLTVTLSVPDTNQLGVPASITIPNGTYYSYFTVRGKAAGRDTVIASALGYSPDTAVYIVTSPRFVLNGGGTMNNFGPGRTLSVTMQDSTGTTHARTTPLTISLASTNPSVITVDSATITVPAGAATSASAMASPVDTGTAMLVATSTGYPPDTITYTVQSPKLSFNFTTATVGKRQHVQSTGAYVSTPDSRTAPLTISLSHSNPAADSLTATSLTIPAASYYAYWAYYGRAYGRDTIIATAPGYLPDTAVVIVTTPKLSVSGLPGTTTTTNPPFNLTVYTQDSLSNSRYASDTVTILVQSTDTTVLRPAQSYVHVLKDQLNVGAAVSVVGPGTAAVIVSDSSGADYLPDTTNFVTVTGPALHFSTSAIKLGMRQSTGPSGIYVYTPNPVASDLTVNLASTDTRVATAPASVTIPGGSSSAYFKIDAVDTLGTVQIQATATGYSGVSTNVQVTQPRFQISTSTVLNTTAPATSVLVYAQDADGASHYVTEDVTVTLASSSPSVASLDSLTVTIPAGAYYSHQAMWSPGVAGTAQMSATDPRAAFYRYTTGTANLTVNTPKLSLSWSTVSLGIGQYLDNVYAAAQDNLPAGGSVTLTYLQTPHTSTVPTSPLSIAPNSYLTYFRIIGNSAGTDSVVAALASPAHYPDTAVVVVGEGRIDPISGWPGSLAVGDSVSVTLYARDPAQGTHPVLAATTWTLAPNANIEFRSGGAVITSATIPAGASYVTFYVKAVAAGTASATFTAANYTPYTNTFTVNP
ncbi:MAG TPA: Ig-like domain-containing protein [Gemmatimonadaceae bacterium]|nr:Ig-like domain-containing protein [Gemmatimonadaceae bacterium]